MNGDLITTLQEENDRLRKEIGRLREGAPETSPVAGEVPEHQFLLDSVPAYLSYVDAQQVYRVVNQRLQEWLGRRTDELVGHSLAEVHGPDSYAEIRPHVESALAGKSVRYVRENTDSSGERYWLDTTYTPRCGADGGVAGFYATTFDVSERHRAALALRAKEERLTSILESLDEVVWSALADFSRLLYLSPSAERVYGREPREFYEAPRLWLETVDARDRDRVESARVELGELGSIEQEYRIQRPDGGVRWIRDRARFISDASGAAMRIDGIASDVTEEHTAREALDAERCALETLVGNLPGMVYRCLNDPDWTMAFVSQASLELTGYAPAELQQGGIGSYGSLVHPDDRDWLWAKCQVSLGQRIPCQNEYRIVRRDGAVRWVWERALGLYDSAGQLLHIEGFVLDITQRKELEEQLLQSQKLESIGRLAGGIAHDFNNLLTAILGYTDLIQLEPGRTPVDLIRVGEIRKAAERARDLTQQLLAFARKQPVQPRVLNLSTLLAGSRSLLRRLLREDIDLDFQLAEELWPIEADPGQLEQSLLNLAVNARDAMVCGGRFEAATANVSVGAGSTASHPGLPPGDWVLLRVSDNGQGMSPEVLQHVFEPFYTTKPTGQGTGLGLATVHGIVSQYGGRIAVTSSPEAGTTFRLYFPRSAEREPDRGIPAVPPAASAELPHGSELILLVEDDDSVRKLTFECLQHGGYRVLVAASGREAIDLAERAGEPIALLLTDVVMPEMGGLEVAEKMRSRQPDLEVLFTSGYTGDSAAQLGWIEQGVDFLPKPFAIKTLLQRVRAMLDRNR